VYKQIGIYANLKRGIGAQKTKLTERNARGEGPHWNVVYSNNNNNNNYYYYYYYYYCYYYSIIQIPSKRRLT
jgi:hypothetical protein